MTTTKILIMPEKKSIQIEIFGSLILACILFFFSGCSLKEKKMEVQEIRFGKTQDGNEVNEYIITNSNGVELSVIEFGAIIKSLKVTSATAESVDIVLGYDDLQGYENDPYYFGATIGRVANRMSNARFLLDSIQYQLAKNTLPDFGPNHLHGGTKGFNKVLWKGEIIKTNEGNGVIFSYLSKDGEEGYPGNVNCSVTYILTNDNEVKIDFKATADKNTVVNLTHHSYFNLKGAGSGDVLKQKVEIGALKITNADEDLIPTGVISTVEGTPFDFSEMKTIDWDFENTRTTKFQGYDINYVLPKHSKTDVILAARAKSDDSKIGLEVYTSQPCMHFYTGNFLEGKSGKGGLAYQQYGAFCFEPQAYPDAPNHNNFESIELNVGEEYHQEIIYKVVLP